MGVKLREKHLNNGNSRYYLDIYFSGKRHTEFLDLYKIPGQKEANKESKIIAEKIRAQRELDLSADANGIQSPIKSKIDFLSYFQKVLDHKKKVDGLRGVHNYDAAFKHLEKYSGGKPVPILSIDEKWIEGFKLHLIGLMRPNTANHYLARFKAVMNQAQKDGVIIRNPASNVKYFPSPEVEKTFLSAEELQAIASAPCKKQVVKLAFLFGCYTGLRFSDIKNLTWGQIIDGKIHFRQKKTCGFEYMDVSPIVAKILSQCRGDTLQMPTAPVFQGLPDKSHVNAYLAEWVKTAKISRHITFHSSRHTFATQLLTAGTELYTVSKLLGHKDISVTAIYAKIVDEKRKAAVFSLPNIEVG